MTTARARVLAKDAALPGRAAKPEHPGPIVGEPARPIAATGALVVAVDGTWPTLASHIGSGASAAASAGRGAQMSFGKDRYNDLRRMSMALGQSLGRMALASRSSSFSTSCTYFVGDGIGRGMTASRR